MTERVFLTGVTGFVGFHILRRIIATEGNRATVRVLVRKLDGADKLRSEFPNVEFIEGDMHLFSQADWERALHNVETVIHAAWYTSGLDGYTSIENSHCLSTTLRLGHAAHRSKVSRFVGIGTCAEYACSNRRLNIDAPVAPVTPYAKAKLAAYFGLSSLFDGAGEVPSFLWCRPFFVYGESKEDGEPSWKLCGQLHEKLSRGEYVNITGGSKVRDFIPVTDCATQIWNLTKSNLVNVANICSGKETSVKELALSVAKLYGAQDRLNFKSTKDRPFDPSYLVGIPTQH